MAEWNVNEVTRILYICENYTVFWNVKEKEYLNKKLKATSFFFLSTSFPCLEVLPEE
jgi:hypothetical protein